MFSHSKIIPVSAFIIQYFIQQFCKIQLQSPDFGCLLFQMFVQKYMNNPIILLRHAQAEHNSLKESIKNKNKGIKIKDSKQYQIMKHKKGLIDNCLTQKGKIQCSQLKNTLKMQQIGLILVSPSRRCLQTAHILIQGFKDIQVKIQPFLFSRITNSWSLGSPKHILESEFPSFNFQKLQEKQLPWFIELLTEQMQAKFTSKHSEIQFLKSGYAQTYFEFKNREKKLGEIIDKELAGLQQSKKMLVISHSKVLKLLTAEDFRQNGKSISKFEFPNAKPYFFPRNELLTYLNPQAKI